MAPPRPGDSVEVLESHRVGTIMAAAGNGKFDVRLKGSETATSVVEILDASAFKILRPPRWLPVTIITYAISLPASFLVFAMYWTLVYAVEACEKDGCSAPRALSVLVHGANFAVMLIDTLLCNQAWRMIHVVYCECHGRRLLVAIVLC